MGPVLPIASNAERVLACNICGGTEHAAVSGKLRNDPVRCASCGLVFLADPEPPRQDGSELADLGAIFGPGDQRFAAGRRAARRRVAVLDRAIGASFGCRLLDIDCSIGLFLLEARRAGFTVCGVERSPELAAFASNRFALDVQAGDWRDAGFPDASFEVVTLFDRVADFGDPLGELAALRRLLRPGGLLLLSTSNIAGLRPRLSSILAQRFGSWPCSAPRTPVYYFSERTLAELTERAGYEVTRIDQIRRSLDLGSGVPRRRKTCLELLACALLAPVALVGPWLGVGDLLYLSAHRPD
jgi:SAM-dependent methyltransferase